MGNFEDRIRYLIREALEEKQVYSKRGFVLITGTKGLDNGIIDIECSIYINLAEYDALEKRLIDNKIQLYKPVPGLSRGPKASKIVKFTSYDQFQKNVENNEELRAFLRLWSPHHGQYNHGVFPTMTAPEWRKFVEWWRRNGYSDDGGMWPGGETYHPTYTEDCKYCQARLKGGFGELHARGVGHPYVPAGLLSKKRRSELLKNNGRGGFCCGDPVRPARLFEDLAKMKQFRSGQAELDPGEEELYDKPGPKTREFLQYANSILMLTVTELYKEDVLNKIKSRMNISPGSILFKHYIVTDPGDCPTLDEEDLLSEEEYRKKREEYGDAFEAEGPILNSIEDAVFGSNDSNLKYIKPRRKFIKKTGIAPTDLRNVFFKPPEHVRLDKNQSYREFPVNVELHLDSSREQWLRKHDDIIDRYVNTTSDPVIGAKSDLARAKEIKKLNNEYDKPKSSFLKKLSDLLSEKFKDPKNHFLYKHPYKSPEGHNYPIKGFKTGIKSLNFLTDSFMPFKLDKLKSMDGDPGKSPDPDDDIWCLVGRADRILYSDLEIWFVKELDITLAPWQKDFPFPIGEDGTIYYIEEDDVIVLDINQQVNWDALTAAIEAKDPRAPKIYESPPEPDENDLEAHAAWKNGVDEAHGEYIKKLNLHYTQQRKKEQIESPEESKEKNLLVPDKNLPPLPKIRGKFLKRGEKSSKFSTITKGCNVMKSLMKIAESILAKKRGSGEITSVEEADAVLSKKLAEVAPKLSKLASECVPSDGDYDYVSELLAILRTSGYKEKSILKDRKIRARPHIHTVVNEHIAWEDKAANDTSLVIDLDAGEYWIANKLRDRKLQRGSKDWWELNIKRLKHKKFVKLFKHGARPCESCRDKKPDVDSCKVCLGTGKVLITGGELVLQMVTDYRSWKAKFLGEKSKTKKPSEDEDDLKKAAQTISTSKRDDEFADRLATFRQFDSKKGAYKLITKQERRDQSVTIAIEKKHLINNVENLIREYDKSIINSGEAYRYDQENKEWVSYKIPQKKLANPKVKFVEYEGNIGLDVSGLSPLDRTAIYLNWAHKSPVGPIKTVEDAMLADLWANVLSRVRTSDFYHTIGLPKSEQEEQLAYTDSWYQMWKDKQDQEKIKITQLNPKSEQESDSEHDENEFDPGGAEEEGWDSDPDLDIPNDRPSSLQMDEQESFEYFQKLTNFYLKESGYSDPSPDEIISPDDALRIGLTQTDIIHAKEHAEQLMTGDVEYDEEDEEDYCEDDEDYEDYEDEGGEYRNEQEMDY